MKIVKKMKGIISFHFYSDTEMNNVLKMVMDFTEGKDSGSLPVLTNLFKGTDGDEIGEFYLIMGQDENRMYIDNEQKKIILNIKFDDLEHFINTIQRFLKDKKISNEELARIMIAKKEYVLQGFNQQYKRFLKKKKNIIRQDENSVSVESIVKRPASVNADVKNHLNMKQNNQ